MTGKSEREILVEKALKCLHIAEHELGKCSSQVKIEDLALSLMDLSTDELRLALSRRGLDQPPDGPYSESEYRIPL